MYVLLGKSGTKLKDLELQSTNNRSSVSIVHAQVGGHDEFTSPALTRKTTRKELSIFMLIRLHHCKAKHLIHYMSIKKDS